MLNDEWIKPYKPVIQLNNTAQVATVFNAYSPRIEFKSITGGTVTIHTGIECHATWKRR